jgi:5,10-methylenetetrahydromethanopterin reductase
VGCDAHAPTRVGGTTIEISLIHPYHLPWPQAAAVIDAADRGGIRTLWLYENPADRGAFTMLGAALALTERLNVGVGVVTPYARASQTTAMEVAQAMVLGSGRVVVGIGAGSSSAATSLGVPFVPPLTAIPQLVEEVRTFRPSSAGPADPDISPRVYVAATGPKMLRLAAEVADGVLLSMHSPPEFLREAVMAVGAHGKQRGAPPVVAYAHAVMAETTQEARRQATAELAPVLTRIGDGAAFQAMAAAGSGALAEPLARTVRDLRDGVPADRAVPDELLRAMCRMGTVEQVAAQLGDLHDTGLDEVAVHAPGADGALLRRLVEVANANPRN